VGDGGRGRLAVVLGLLLAVPLATWNGPGPLAGLPGVPEAATARGRLAGLRLTEPPADAGRPRVVLLVGSDRRARLPDRFGDLQGERADAVMLVGLHPARRRVQVLSLPRELQVEVAGLGPGRLASALTYGGAAGLVEAVRRLTGLPVHHYLQLDFEALAVAVDAVGGVTLRLPHPARDRVTGFRAGAGPRRLDGAMAVAYARSRRYEERRGGAWTPSDAGDVGRIRRQQRLLLALGRQRPGLSPSRLASGWFGLGGHLRADAGLTPLAGWRLLSALRSWPVAAGDLATLPTRPLVAPADAVSPFPPLHPGTVRALRPREPAASRLLAAFGRGDPLSPVPGLQGA
jgi:LCP family protein required for cell wall assembly